MNQVPHMHIHIATTDAQLVACCPVMRELRPHIAAEQFVARVRGLQREGYRVAYVQEADRVVAVAGYRVCENLAWGRFLYVDDLVTLSTERSRGHGAQLLTWLRGEARAEGCAQVHLDSGVQRKEAHRFYEREGMTLSSFHFAEKLAPLVTALFFLGCGPDLAEAHPDAGADGVGGADGGVPVVCEPPQEPCDGTCVDTASSTASCGACGTACAAGQRCVDSLCVCSEGMEVCDGACVDRSGNAAHCGLCGRVCGGETPECVDGVCVATCREGQVRCSGSCVDPAVDAAHCGGCGVACPADDNEVGVCIDRVCDTVCAAGWHDVDPAAGCEYRCDATPGRIEVCDGLDNDCNRLTDAADPALRAEPCPEQRGVCDGATPRCDGAEPRCDELTYAAHAAPAPYQQGGETRCDGLDNDCDGEADEDCCDTFTAPLAAHEAVPPAGFVWQVDRQVRGHWDGEAVVLVWQRAREAVGGGSATEVVLGRVGPDGGEPRAPVVLVASGDFTAWDAVVDADGVELLLGDADGHLRRQRFDLRGAPLAPAAEIDAVGALAGTTVGRIHMGLSGLLAIQARSASTGRYISVLVQLTADGWSLDAFEEPGTNSAALAIEWGVRRHRLLRVFTTESSQRLEGISFTARLAREEFSTLFPTTTWPGLIDAEFSTHGGAALVPNVDSGWLELVTLTDAGVERLRVASASEPGSTAVGRDADDGTLLAWPEAGADDLADVWIARLDGTTGDDEPAEAALTLRGRIRGFGAMPLDLVEGPDRAWVVLQTWSGDLRTRRLAVYPLSAEGVPRCE